MFMTLNNISRPAIRPNSLLTTQSETTNPAGRIFPRRIVPWDDFATRLEDIWDDLTICNGRGDLCEPIPTIMTGDMADLSTIREKIMDLWETRNEDEQREIALITNLGDRGRETVVDKTTRRIPKRL
ncbi:hypothetical protein G6O67_001718 [Ophiocordyceps sinensis]|uniref:Uncharacterized protein n=1 Tax=Ophiocordyceps sinensis TaxID=72228 RepID=A0A8H4V9F6_9HYPO|nr:hypothetical protein G6O67_001718 [Ophiocordyceps sinensis]